jgi:hypothetical protein
MNTTTQQPGDTGLELQRVAEAARDSLTDEMVARLAGTAGDAVDLIDQVNRSGLGKAIPALARMVENGDLDRLVQLARVYGSAEDSVTDEMIGRMSDAVGGGLSLLDQVNRSGLERALPVLSRMVADGDLERLAQLARVYSSAEDSITDEMVGRLAETVSEGLSLLDRLNRGGAGRFVEMMERMQSTGALERIATVLPKLLDRIDGLERLLQAADAVATKAAAGPPERGGLGGLWSMARDPETQTAMRFLSNLGKELRSSHKR